MTGPKIILIGAALMTVIGYAIYRPTTVTTLRASSHKKPASVTPGGYLSSESLADGPNLLPPPPAAGSAAMQKDEIARAAALKFKGSPRYAEAVADASRAFPDMLHGFSCALGTDIDAAHMPRTYKLLTRVQIDVRHATYPFKNRYQRPRPFAVHSAASCLPADDPMLRQEGSYPGGQSGIGMIFGNILAELDPARAQALRQRGWDFGQSRVICDGQWQSDVDAGRELGQLVLARLRKNAAFNADLAAAKAEAAGAARSGAPPPGQCTAAATLANR